MYSAIHNTYEIRLASEKVTFAFIYFLYSELILCYIIVNICSLKHQYFINWKACSGFFQHVKRKPGIFSILVMPSCTSLLLCSKLQPFNLPRKLGKIFQVSINTSELFYTLKNPAFVQNLAFCTCVAQDYQYYNKSSSLYHELCSIPLVQVNMISPCKHHESKSIWRIKVYITSASLCHVSISIQWVQVYVMRQSLAKAT